VKNSQKKRRKNLKFLLWFRIKNKNFIFRNFWIWNQ